MLISETVMVKWHGNNRKWYESKGYIFTRFKDKFEVKVEDLSKGCNVNVKVKCDSCGEILDMSWVTYNNTVKKGNKNYCQKCANILFGSKKSNATKLKTAYLFTIGAINTYQRMKQMK